ncbi:MAG: efflux RND transporter periplasmic adaptor subunit [Brevinematales bacterium]|jgi:membrane fusion protein (multidrug efflux system)
MAGEELRKPEAKESWWMSREAKLTGIGILAAFVLGFAIWFFAFRPYISTDDARIDADVVRIANIGASGQILSVYVKEGDPVTNGMVLIELDHSIAEEQYQQSKVKYEYEKAIFDRTAGLFAKDGSTKQQYELARAQSESAGIELKLAEIALERTYLKSPANGVVIQKIAVPGNILEANQIAVTIADLDHAWVSANINEKAVGSVKPGQPVEITIDEGGKAFGRVLDIRKAAASAFSIIPADNATGNFIKVIQRIPVKITIDRVQSDHFRLGESVEIRIKVK